MMKIGDKFTSRKDEPITLHSSKVIGAVNFLPALIRLWLSLDSEDGMPTDKRYFYVYDYPAADIQSVSVENFQVWIDRPRDSVELKEGDEMHDWVKRTTNPNNSKVFSS